MARQTLPAAKPATAPPAAIRRAYPYLKTALSFLIPTTIALYRLLAQLASKFSKPILFLSPIPIIFYLISPIVVFCDVVLDLLIWTPLRTAIYLFDALYPVYVLGGVACITGCLLGLLGRYMSDTLVKFVMEIVPQKAAQETELSVAESHKEESEE
ncbi:hypothetical protein APHAL10511_008523 [Amanita phalloides]|nr:hypothetical protein APHAL10511_008523 [Amanita phalloides]